MERDQVLVEEPSRGIATRKTITKTGDGVEQVQEGVDSVDHLLLEDV
jgi:hypothetical protein